jgi:hypothetical protein
MILELIKNNIASDEVQKQRIDICRSCDNYKIFYCDKCGCALSLKTKMSKAKCPINKWGKTNAI